MIQQSKIKTSAENALDLAIECLSEIVAGRSASLPQIRKAQDAIHELMKLRKALEKRKVIAKGQNYSEGCNNPLHDQKCQGERGDCDN